MADVAAAAGVSAMTVSRALRLPDSVSEAVRLRIEEASRQLGFVPSRHASALASARSLTVSVLIPSLTNNVFIDLLAGVQEVLAPRGYQPLIGITGYDAEEEERMLRTHLGQDPDGMIVTGFDQTPAARELLRTLKVPTVHTMDLSDAEDEISIGLSQYDAGHAVGRFLIERGRRRIGIVAAQMDPRTQRRCAGWRQALRDAGLHDEALEMLVPDASTIALGAELLERIMAAHPDVDALFLCNDDLAQGAVFQCARLGIAVPERLALVGFNDLPSAAWTSPPLTTVSTPRHAIGHEAARLLLALIEGEREGPRRLDLGFRLEIRGTT